jgi:uncharacterized protein YggE
MNSLFSNTPMRMLGGLTVFMALIALGSYASLNFETIKHLDSEPATISVTGEGEVLAVPDIGQFTFSVKAEAKDATAAQEQSGTAVNNIIAFLKESGVEEKDIKTLNYNLYPKYDWVEQICAPGTFCDRGKQVQTGFEVNQSVQVKVRNTDDASTIITGVGEREATNISGLDFVIDDTEALAVEARALAITDAKTKAATLAEDLGVDLVKIAGYSEEDSRYTPSPYQNRTMSLEMAEDSAFGGAELPVGEEQTTARVTITYEVR